MMTRVRCRFRDPSFDYWMQAAVSPVNSPAKGNLAMNTATTLQVPKPGPKAQARTQLPLQAGRADSSVRGENNP